MRDSKNSSVQQAGNDGERLENSFPLIDIVGSRFGVLDAYTGTQPTNRIRRDGGLDGRGMVPFDALVGSRGLTRMQQTRRFLP